MFAIYCLYPELSNYPICDTDIWVDVILAKLDDELIGKYEKIVVVSVFYLYLEEEYLEFLWFFIDKSVFIW